MRSSKINQLLFLYTILTSPVLAIYSIAPLYIFEKLNLHNSALLFIGLTISIFISWCINIFVCWRFAYLANWKQFLLAFVFSSVTHLPKVWLKPLLPFDNVIAAYLTYPIITTLAIQIIIWIIINAVVANFKRKKIEEEVKELKLSNLEAQKQTLIQQLQPHFLFNSLSVLKSLITEDANKAEDYAIQLSNFLRYSVQIHTSDLVSLQEELTFTKNYIALQKVRFQDSIKCNIHEPSKEQLNMRLPIFALQTLVENAIKHNAFTNTKPLYIEVEFLDKTIQVYNNLIPKTNLNPTGTGLNNLKKRYQLLANLDLEINKSETQFSVTIYLI